MNRERQSWTQSSSLIILKLIVSEEFDTHPFPKVEKYINRYSDRQEKAIETHTTRACASLWEILIHTSRVKKSQKRHDWNQDRHSGKRKHHLGSQNSPLITVLSLGFFLNRVHENHLYLGYFYQTPQTFCPLVFSSCLAKHKPDRSEISNLMKPFKC